MGERGQPTVVRWEDFRTAMDLRLLKSESEAGATLDVLKGCCEVLSELTSIRVALVDREPDKCAAISLGATSFRVCIAAVLLSLSGYPDSAMNLSRTLLEINLLLSEVKGNPRAASLGLFLTGIEQEIKEAVSYLQGRRGEEANRSEIQAHLEDIKKLRDRAEAIIEQHGLCAEDLRRRYRRPNVREALKRLALEPQYSSVYGPLSRRVHRPGLGSHVFKFCASPCRGQLVLGPLDQGCVGDANLAVMVLVANLAIASLVFGKANLVKKCEALRQRLKMPEG